MSRYRIIKHADDNTNNEKESICFHNNNNIIYNIEREMIIVKYQVKIMLKKLL